MTTEWKRDFFSVERGAHTGRVHEAALPHYTRNSSGWILFGPQDVRDRKRKWFFALQKLNNDRDCRVRVGCRYFTLAQAWAHWSKKARSGGTYSYNKNEGKQALAIVGLMVLQAQAYGLLSRSVKFDSSIVKRRK